MPPSDVLPVFAELGCAACHKPQVDAGGETLHPFTDMLLHDMGEGLAEPVGEGAASGREWRTAPLLGLHKTVARVDKAAYLHDGRARTLQEAIAWHGGEARASRDAFFALTQADRAALIEYLKGL